MIVRSPTKSAPQADALEVYRTQLDLSSPPPQSQVSVPGVITAASDQPITARKGKIKITLVLIIH